ncbi:MAG TPA: DUF1707 domain-containing protein [Solirubrobacteraceae bacterium]|nr:DUF1707 domain-containing protein [Solirubrobacteraceae bacterium]
MCGHHRQRHHHQHRTTFAADDKRASDAERDSVVSDLRAHAADGRLSVEELDRRVAAALAAPTRRELAALLDDLPRRPRPPTDRRDFREHLRAYVMVMALLVAIWALTGAGYFWPVWPMLGWGIGVWSHASAVGGFRPRRGRAFG